MKLEKLKTSICYRLGSTARAFADEDGQALVEYGLILMFVSVAALGISPVGQWVAARLAGLAAAL